MAILINLLNLGPGATIAAGKAKDANGRVDIKRACPVFGLIGARITINVARSPAYRILPCPYRSERVDKSPTEHVLWLEESAWRAVISQRSPVPAILIGDIAAVRGLEAVNFVDAVCGDIDHQATLKILECATCD